MGRLVLRRRRSEHESLDIGSDITITAHPYSVEINIGEIHIRMNDEARNVLRFAIDAPEEIIILRKELQTRNQQEKALD